MSRRPDLADVREVLDPNKTSVVTGFVVKPPHEPLHYVIEERDVFVWVKFVPAENLRLCRLGTTCGGRLPALLADGVVTQAVGIWAIPQEGTEVQVTIPHGDDRTDAVITNTLSTGLVPFELVLPPGEIPQDQIIVIKHRNVTIRSVGFGGGIQITALGNNVTIRAEPSDVNGGEVTIDGAQITLNGGTLKVARATDPVSVTASAAAMQASIAAYINTGTALAVTSTGTITDGVSTVKA